MRKIYHLMLALVAASMGSLPVRADRVAPTMPASVTPVSGQTYYLYNVDEGLFLTHDADSDPYLGPQGRPVTVTIDEKGMLLNLPQQKSEYYKRLCVWNSDFIGRRSNNDTDNRCYFAIAEAENGDYLIQVASCNTTDYNEAQYVGGKSGESKLYHTYAIDGPVHWHFYAEEEGTRYIAEKSLYDALSAADKYSDLIDTYEEMYANRENQTSATLNSAAATLKKATAMSTGYQTPWWNERPILFYTADGNFGESEGYTWRLNNYNNGSYTNGTYFTRYLGNSGETSTITATVLVEEPSTLVYSLSDNPPSLKVFVDGELVRELLDEQCNHYFGDATYTRFFEDLEPGMHTIKWTLTALEWKGYAQVNLRDVGVMSKPQINVSLLEPGSLGTEVLYNTDHVKNVRRLKVKGAMNDDDWERIKMMSTLMELDLSEAQFTEIPEKQFRVYYNTDSTMRFLHKVVLPEGLTKINSEAFLGSFVEEVNFPSTLQNIGYQAFYMSHIRKVDMPDNLTEMGKEVFRDAYWLTEANLPKNLTTIPYQTFESCYYLNKVTLPEKLETVDTYAFHECHSLQTTLPVGLKTVGSRAFEGCWNFYPRLPEGLTTIRNAAFNTCNAMDSLVVPASVSTIEEYAFCNCQNLKYAELSVSQYKIPKAIFDNTPKLEVLKLNSATVVNPTIDGSTYPHRNITQLTLKVPHYLVNSYKLHNYWYNAKAIEPFDYSDMEYIPIRGNLTMNHERFGGQPSVFVDHPYYLKVNGTDVQEFNDFGVARDYNDKYGYGQMLSNCPNLSVEGEVYVDYKTQANRWNFISLPFDLDVSRITHYVDGIQFAIRYYDGSGRASNGKTGNWKNYEPTDIIPAGTGFILQTNKDCWTRLYAANNTSKQNMVAYKEFTKPLALNASETASDRGWNLVGNPYQCYFNNHMLNFTAPITIWNPDNKTYTAYSLTDDDYAIRPNEAFFVQCPGEEVQSISFPLQGRQLTDVIESQNAVKAMQPQADGRRLIDLTLSRGDVTDRTRVVFNPEASEVYETHCDAGKFMSMETSVQQIYTLDEDGNRYAINERPEGTVRLGFYAGENGAYTFSAVRNTVGDLYLTDLLTQKTVNLRDEDYTFDATAGTDEARFVLTANGDADGIAETMTDEQPTGSVMYDLQGRRVEKAQRGLYIVNGKKTVIQ